MKYTKHNRRGYVIIIMLVIIGLLAVVSTALMKQAVIDRRFQEARINRAQLELFEADMARSEFRKCFDGQKGMMSANFFEFRTNQHQEYNLVVDLTGKPVSTSAHSNRSYETKPKAL